MLLRALAACLLASWASDPYECPEGQAAVRDRIKGEWVCKPKLKMKRTVFGAQKHPQDPCPDGYWWHKNREYCLPVVCTEEPNPSELKNLCPAGHHEHLNSGSDWTAPIQCVEDYHPRNESNGGAPLRQGSCSRCVINKPGHQGRQQRPWAFEKPGAPGNKQAQTPGPAAPSPRLGVKKPAAREVKPCSKGQFSAPSAGKCSPCPEGAASAKRDDGRMFCVGGKSEPPCPAGAGMVAAGDGAEPLSCVPCISGEESIVFNGLRRCARHSCPEESLPVPAPGWVDDYVCLQPLESSPNWARVLESNRMNPAEAPQCQSGQGLVLSSGKFQCRRCGEGQTVVRRNGYPTCGKTSKPVCPEGEALPADGKGKCAPCPEGSKYSLARGFGAPRCVPENAPQSDFLP